jgi:hypothetical protein
MEFISAISRIWLCTRNRTVARNGTRQKDNRHERTCEATVRNKFPGGAHKVPQTIFDLLADEGIDIHARQVKVFPL